MRILLAEDEKEMANALCEVLKHNNYSVDTVYNGLDAYTYALTDIYDILVFDIMMPKLSGTEALSRLRREGINTPALFLTARSSVQDRIDGLDIGADDYLTKPFAMGELLARLRAITRRKGDITPNEISFGNVTLNRNSFELISPSGRQHLGSKEFQMIEMLMLSPKRLISTDLFMQQIWGNDSDTEINVVWVYISYLRKKLSVLNANIQIKATRGIGYSLEER